MKLRDLAPGTKFEVMGSIFERVEDQNLQVDKHLYGENRCKKMKMNARVISLISEPSEENPYMLLPVIRRGILQPGRLVRFGPNRDVKVIV